MIVVERVTMNPAPPSSCAPACSRDDSQQETGNPEHASAQPEGGRDPLRPDVPANALDLP